MAKKNVKCEITNLKLTERSREKRFKDKRDKNCIIAHDFSRGNALTQNFILNPL